MVDMKVEGIDEIIKKIKTLDQKLQKKIVTGAVRDGAKPMIKEARRLVPVRTGNLKKSIGVVKMKYPKGINSKYIWFVIGPRKTKSVDGFYGAMVEFGTKTAQPKPYLRLAYEAKGHEALEASKASLKKRFEREMRKLGR